MIAFRKIQAWTFGLWAGLCVGAAWSPTSAQAQLQSPRLYVIDCGTLIYNTPDTYNLTRQEVKNTNMSVPCYLVVHPRGTLLFDAGLGDRYVGRPFNETPLGDRPDPPATAYFNMVTKTLKSQLEAAGYPQDKIEFLALSHIHADHIGNAGDFKNSTWLVHQGDYDAIFGPNATPSPISPTYASLKTGKLKVIDGDYDVFGDGTIVLKFTPGHTPGHQSLYVKLARTGGIVLTGDLYHYPEERTLNRMPDREKTTETPASRAKIESFLKETNSQLWVGHDIGAYSKQKHAPEYYD